MKLILSRISHPAGIINDADKIKNIIFDFGNVICNIDVARTEKAFNQLGIKSFKEKNSVSDPSGMFEQFETGLITPEQFRDSVRNFFSTALSDDQIDQAWNELLLDIPVHRINLLESVRTNYRIFILSNSNKIHYDKYSRDFIDKYHYKGFDDLFEKAWFSFNIGLKKPHPEIFSYIIRQCGLIPHETLFIDDTLKHVDGANSLGIHAHHLLIDSNQDISFLFS